MRLATLCQCIVQTVQRGRWLGLGLAGLTAVVGFSGWLDLPRPTSTIAIPGPSAMTLSADSGTLVAREQQWIPHTGGVSDVILKPVPGPTHCWDVKTGRWLRSLGEPTASYVNVALSPDASWAVLLDAEGHLTLWDAVSGLQHATLPTELLGRSRDLATTIQFSPDSRFVTLVSRERGSAHVWEVSPWRHLGRVEIDTEENPTSFPVFFSPDGRTFATVRERRGVTLWDTSNGLQSRTLEISPFPVERLKFSPNGRLLAGTNVFPREELAVELWDVPSGQLRVVLPRTRSYGEYRPQPHLDFSSDSRLLLAHGGPSDSLLWDVSNTPPTPLDEVAAPAIQSTELFGASPFYPARSTMFSPEGRWIAVPQRDSGTCTILNARTLGRVMVLPSDREGGSTSNVAFSSSGEIVALERLRMEAVGKGGSIFRPAFTICRCKTVVQVYDVQTGTELGEALGRLQGFTWDGVTLVTRDERISTRGLPTSTNAFGWEITPRTSVSGYVGLSASVLGLVLLAVVMRERVLARRSADDHLPSDSLNASCQTDGTSTHAD